jgi:hypothetical protein
MYCGIFSVVRGITMPQITDLGDYRRQREAELTPAVVEREADPDNPNRSYFLITADTSAAVQGAINGLVAEVESFASGHGMFIGPRRGGPGYWAIGETVVNPDITGNSP